MSTIIWLGEDIKGYRPDWTDDQCDYVMDEIGTRLSEACIEFGHDIMEGLIQEFEAENPTDCKETINDD